MMKTVILAGSTIALMTATVTVAGAADLPRREPVYKEAPMVGKMPIGKAPIGKSPIGKAPIAAKY